MSAKCVQCLVIFVRNPELIKILCELMRLKSFETVLHASLRPEEPEPEVGKSALRQKDVI